MEPCEIVKRTLKDLAVLTDNFSEDNYIGRFQHGKLYRAMLNYKNGIVKIWEVPKTCNCSRKDNELRLMDELIFLRHEVWIHHPGMLWIYGYCSDGEHLGAVYEVESKPLDSVFNLIPKDSFSWQQRIKTALELAALLKFLHTGRGSICPPIAVNNLAAGHLVLDEEYRLKLCDFGSIIGGIFPERDLCLGNDTIGCYGYTDVGTDHFSDKQDVFAFGVILVSLISKRVHTGEPFVYRLAGRESESNMKYTEFSLVHESLAIDHGFCVDDGHEVTKLALICMNRDESQRPDMKKIYKLIRSLKVVKRNSAFFKASKKLRRSEIELRWGRELKSKSDVLELRSRRVIRKIYVE